MSDPKPHTLQPLGMTSSPCATLSVAPPMGRVSGAFWRGVFLSCLIGDSRLDTADGGQARPSGKLWGCVTGFTGV